MGVAGAVHIETLSNDERVSVSVANRTLTLTLTLVELASEFMLLSLSECSICRVDGCAQELISVLSLIPFPVLRE